MANGQPKNPASQFIWQNSAPPRVQMFIWLLIRGRIQCRRNLFLKKIVDSPSCLACGATEECPDHIVFHCPIAAQFWSSIGVPCNPDQRVNNLQNLQKPSSIPNDQSNAFIALCCWQLWKRRNGVVFRDERLSLRNLLLACRAEASLWRARMPKKSKVVIDAWSSLFDTSANVSQGQ